MQQLLSSTTLTRIHDNELAVSESEDCLTAAELIATLTQDVFAEVLDPVFDKESYTTRVPAVSSLRRNLQRALMKMLAEMALGESGAPQDCQTIAYVQLQRLQSGIEQVLRDHVNLDDYSKAHLQETASRVQRVLQARFVEYQP